MSRLPVLVVGLLAAAALAGCGQQNPKLIPQSNASALTSTADKVAQACANGDKAGARSALVSAGQQVSELPPTVDSRLRRNLRQWIAHIGRRIDQDCKAQSTPTPTPSPSPSPTPTPSPSPTPTPTPTPTATPPATPTPSSTPKSGGGAALPGLPGQGNGPVKQG